LLTIGGVDKISLFTLYNWYSHSQINMSRLAKKTAPIMVEPTFEEEEESTEEAYIGQHPMLSIHKELKLKQVEKSEDHLEKYTEVNPFADKLKQ